MGSTRWDSTADEQPKLQLNTRLQPGCFLHVAEFDAGNSMPVLANKPCDIGFPICPRPALVAMILGRCLLCAPPALPAPVTLWTLLRTGIPRRSLRRSGYLPHVGGKHIVARDRLRLLFMSARILPA